MGQNQSGLPGQQPPTGQKEEKKEKKKFEPTAPPTRVGRKQKRQKGPEAASRLPTVTPATKCKLRYVVRQLSQVQLIMPWWQLYVLYQRHLSARDQ
jgi:26S proteasome regulatory subunit T2